MESSRQISGKSIESNDEFNYTYLPSNKGSLDWIGSWGIGLEVGGLDWKLRDWIGS